MKNRIGAFIVALGLLAGCAMGAAAESGEAKAPELLLPVASGVKTVTGRKAVIDYSNIQDGYVMTKFTAESDRRLKVKVIGPSTEYIYNINCQEWTTFPLGDGDGDYTVKVYEENPATGKYAVVATAKFTAALTDEFAPFLRPNQYVNYENAPDTLAKAAELTAEAEDPLEKVEKVYDFVVGHLTYDKKLAQTVQKTYLPVLDDVLAGGKGICFDYAALMTAMLRSQGIPCKLVTGYVGASNAYHAWISVWTEETGWVDGAIYFDGAAWHRMDPTFASSGNSSQSIMKYIGDGKNYSVKAFY